MNTTRYFESTEREICSIQSKDGEGREGIILPENDTTDDRNTRSVFVNIDSKWTPSSELHLTRKITDIPLASGGDRSTRSDAERADGFLMGEDGFEEFTIGKCSDTINHHDVAPLGNGTNFKYVFFANEVLTPWFFSPYDDDPWDAGLDIPSDSDGHRNTPSPHADLPITSFVANRAYLFVCKTCFKYFYDKGTWVTHQAQCQVKLPPNGKCVYHSGTLRIWKVDGAISLLYCQNLALFSKLFINAKARFFDIDDMFFYVLTKEEAKGHHQVVGYFSKEKHPVGNHNVNSILTIPLYMRRGYGTLLIEFSYELSRRAEKIEGPELPLSNLGALLYLSFWISTTIRFLRRALSAKPPDLKYPFTTTALHPPYVTSISRANTRQAKSQKEGKGRYKSKRNRAATKTGANMEPPPDSPRVALCPVSHYPSFSSPSNASSTAAFTTERFFTHNHDYNTGIGSTYVSVRCTVEELARAMWMRTGDLCMTLNEANFLCQEIAESWHKGWDQRFARNVGAGTSMNSSNVVDGGGDTNRGEDLGGEEVLTISDFVSKDAESGEERVKALLITREMIEEAARIRKVKKPLLDPESIYLEI